MRYMSLFHLHQTLMSVRPLPVRASAQTQEVATFVVVQRAMSSRPTSSAAKVRIIKSITINHVNCN